MRQPEDAVTTDNVPGRNREEQWPRNSVTRGVVVDGRHELQGEKDAEKIKRRTRLALGIVAI